MLFYKAIGFRVIVILFTAIFFGFQASLALNAGLFLLYYLYDVMWDKYMVSYFHKK